MNFFSDQYSEIYGYKSRSYFRPSWFIKRQYNSILLNDWWDCTGQTLWPGFLFYYSNYLELPCKMLCPLRPGSNFYYTTRSKKHIDQEPPYLMRQICVLQREEIKTRNSGAKHQLSGRGNNKIYCYRRHEQWLLNARIFVTCDYML